MKIFERDSIEFMLWLSREEWQLVHGVSFAWEVHGLMPEDLALRSAYRFVIAELQRGHGYEFEGLAVDHDDDLWAKTEQPICPGNLLTIQLMLQGSAPDLLVHLPAAIAYAGERVPGLDVEPLRQTLRDLERKVDEIREVRPDLPVEVQEQIRAAVHARGAYFRQTKNLA